MGIHSMHMSAIPIPPMDSRIRAIPVPPPDGLAGFGVTGPAGDRYGETQIASKEHIRMLGTPVQSRAFKGADLWTGDTPATQIHRGLTLRLTSDMHWPLLMYIHNASSQCAPAYVAISAE